MKFVMKTCVILGISAIMTAVNITHVYAQTMQDPSELDYQNKKLKSAEERILKELKAERAIKDDFQTKASLQIDNIPPSNLQAGSDEEFEIIQKTKSQNSSDSTALSPSQQRVNQLLKQLKETRSKLMIADAEVSRLSELLENEHRKTMPASSYKKIKNNNLEKTQVSFDEKTDDDMPIITVVVDKANLRSGPGRNNSPLMTVAKGTRLAVESRLGDWYRIISPTGTRAWVSSEVIRFGRNSTASPSRTIKVQGVETASTAEAEAFRALRKSYSGS